MTYGQLYYINKGQSIKIISSHPNTLVKKLAKKNLTASEINVGIFKRIIKLKYPAK